MKKNLLLSLFMLISMVAWSADGDTFTANTIEGVEMTFKVISEADKTCQVGVGLGFEIIPAISETTTGAITIPSIVNGYQVTTIATNAFANCSGITDINIPNTITSMERAGLASTEWYNNQPDGVVYLQHILYNWKGTMTTSTSVDIREGTVCIAEGAFFRCSKLQSITIPQSVINIGNESFFYCNGLSKVVIPSSVTTIGASAFSGCSSLSNVTFLGNVTSVGQYAFNSTPWLNNQQGLVYIGSVAYKYCGSMTAGSTISINDGTIEISARCFEQCTSLASITLPSSLKRIGARAFAGCSSLVSVEIPNNVISIGNSAFSHCSGLTSITLPNSLKTIERYLFEYCTSLTSVTIPNSVTKIRSSAYAYCSSLTSIIIPSSVINIADNFVTSASFVGCTSLSSISIDENNTVFDSRNNCNAIIESATNTLLFGCNNTVIPEGVEKIEANAFITAQAMTELIIPESVTEIEGDLFDYNNSSLSAIIELSKTPPTLQEDPFNTGHHYNATLYVPYGCKAAYEAADYWKEFMEIVEMEPTYNCIVLDENSTDAPNEASGVDVIVKRTLNAGEWSTICLPFAMTTEQMKEAFGEGVQVKDFTGYEVTGESSISVKFRNVTSMEACHPYIIKVEEAVTEFTVDGVDIVVSDDPRVSYGMGSGNKRKLSDFVGTLVADFNFYENATNTPLFLSGGQFWYASEQTQTMKAFRAYFDFDDDFADEATSRISMEFVDNEQVGVDSAIMNNEQCTMNNEVYDLQGRKVENSQLQVGLYIKNGKKIIIK